jgi:hypothetical protein
VDNWGLNGWEGTYISLVGLPENFNLMQNYPNPFNAQTTITFTMPYTAEVSLKVYNALGQEVETLLEGELSAGDHSVMWNASGKASGMYFYRLKSGDFVSVKKCLLLK